MRVRQPESRTVSKQPTAVLRATLRHSELGDWFGTAFYQVAVYLHRHGVAPCGFPFARHHIRPDGSFEVEAGLPVPAAITGDAQVRPSCLPGGHVVAVWHIGPDEQRGTASQALDDWLKTEHAVRAGDPWEIYHDPPHRDPSSWRTEVIQPFALVPADVDAGRP